MASQDRADTYEHIVTGSLASNIWNDGKGWPIRLDHYSQPENSRREFTDETENRLANDMWMSYPAPKPSDFDSSSSSSMESYKSDIWKRNEFTKVEIDALFHLECSRDAERRLGDKFTLLKHRKPLSNVPPLLVSKISDSALLGEAADDADPEASAYFVAEITMDANLVESKLVQLERMLVVLLCRAKLHLTRDDVNILEIVRFAGLATNRMIRKPKPPNKIPNVADAMTKFLLDHAARLPLLSILWSAGRVFIFVDESKPLTWVAKRVSETASRASLYNSQIQLYDVEVAKQKANQAAMETEALAEKNKLDFEVAKAEAAEKVSMAKERTKQAVMETEALAEKLKLEIEAAQVESTAKKVAAAKRALQDLESTIDISTANKIDSSIIDNLRKILSILNK